jgi:hypothetical protein
VSAGEWIAASAFSCPDGNGRRVRSRPNRFAVAPGHTAPDVESVVKEYPHFWILEKRGKAGEVSENLE